MKKLMQTKYYLLRFFLKLGIVLILIPLIYNYIPVNKGKETFYLPSSKLCSVINTLHENGYGVSIVDKIMLYFFTPPKEGWYTVHSVPTERFSFFEMLTSQKARTMQVKIYAGETSQELSKRLANDMKLNEKVLLQEYVSMTRFLEADIFSGRYRLARKADEHTVMDFLFRVSNKKLHTFKTIHNIESKNQLKLLLIIASIIQKETNDPNEMPLVSSVIQNRLNNGMKLQMDATLNYGKHAHKVITSERIKEDKSHYNTYRHSGLPPIPLCTVSIEALNAALFPSDTDYFYFMVNKKGKHDFSVTYKEHIENIRSFKKGLKKTRKKTTKVSAK